MFYVIQGALRGERPRDVARRSTIIGVVSFLTLIDLFGSQALLPQLIVAFEADPGLMGFAVNASTLGMAASSLVIAWFADRIDRKRGIWISLALLSIPTVCLGLTDDVWVFMGLRIAQGVCMAAAFTLTMTYLSEQCDITATGGALAAYITGNVLSNLVGRLLAVSAADLTGLSGSFFTFAALNLLGAVVAFVLIGPKDDAKSAPTDYGSPWVAWKFHLGTGEVRATFFIGFIILFAFVGVFTYVNLHLVDVLGLSPMSLGLVYLVFIPAVITTPLAANLVRVQGPQKTMVGALALSLVALGLTLVPSLWFVLPGLAIFGAAIFFAQAAATGFLSAVVQRDNAAASGLYLTSYYLGGLAGSLLLGIMGAADSWPIAAVTVSGSLLIAIALAWRLEPISQKMREQVSDHMRYQHSPHDD
ncbi:MAG: MFS transporter [Pseudomonadota bacterium]